MICVSQQGFENLSCIIVVRWLFYCFSKLHMTSLGDLSDATRVGATGWLLSALLPWARDERFTNAKVTAHLLASCWCAFQPLCSLSVYMAAAVVIPSCLYSGFSFLLKRNLVAGVECSVDADLSSACSLSQVAAVAVAVPGWSQEPATMSAWLEPGAIWCFAGTSVGSLAGSGAAGSASSTHGGCWRQGRPAWCWQQVSNFLTSAGLDNKENNWLLRKTFF